MENNSFNPNQQPPNPVPSQVSNSKNSKIIPIGLGVIVVLIVATGAYLLGTKQTQPVVQNTIQTTPIPSPSVAIDVTANWKTYDGVYPIHFLYPKNLKLSEGDADFFSSIRLWNPLGDDRDNEFSISMLNESSLYYRSAAQLVQEKQQEGFTKEKDLYVDGILASQLKGIATPNAFIASRMTTTVVVQANGKVYTITNWRSTENASTFDQILSTFKFTQ